MQVKNIHERRISVPATLVGALIDTLASKGDQLWPSHKWPPMKFDKDLKVGAKGGHGPIRYFIQSYEPGKSIHFQFTSPKCFNGYHSFRVEQSGAGAVLRHILEMKTSGLALLSWPLIFRPLHDALLEDSLDKAERNMRGNPSGSSWTWWVKALRWLLSKQAANRRSS